MIETIRQGFKAEGIDVSIAKLCAWFGVPRRTFHYRPVTSPPKVQGIPCSANQGDDRGESLLWLPHRCLYPAFQQKHGAEDLPDQGLAGAQTARGLPAAHRGPDLSGRQTQRTRGDRPVPRLGRSGRLGDFGAHRRLPQPGIAGLASRQKRGKARPAESALEQARIARFGTLGRVHQPFLLRSDNGLVFTSRSYTKLVRSYGLKPAFITPQHNGLIERLIRTLKDPCLHRHRFETAQHASPVIGDWMPFYNTRRPPQALGMKTPAEAFALAG